MHAGIAEVAAAKARMFVNKPDGSMSFLLQILLLMESSNRVTK